jgi:hypothetical protein
MYYRYMQACNIGICLHVLKCIPDGVQDTVWYIVYADGGGTVESASREGNV